MADAKISALAAAAALSGGEKLLAVQSGGNVAVTPNQLAAFLGGRSWYVANGGSDANAGLSATAPFQTLAKVRTVMATGDTVLLRCGSIFRESFDISGLGRVTVGSYGAGTRPVIDGADAISESWSLVSGNVYRVQVTVPEIGYATQVYPGIFENGLLLAEKDIVLDGLSTPAARVAAVQAMPGSFLLESPVAYRDGYAAGATFSYIVQATGGGNPASNGKLYEVRKRLYTIVHAGALISGITFRRQLSHNGAQYLANPTAASLPGKWTNCVFDQMPSHATIDSLSDYDDCIAMRPNPKYPGRYLFHAYGPAGQGNTMRYRRCKAIGDGVTNTAGFGTHSGATATYPTPLGIPCQAKIIYEECENYGTTGFGGYDFAFGDYIRCRNVDCLSDVSVGASYRLIDCDFRGASGLAAWSPPGAGCTATLIRTKWVALTAQAFLKSDANAGSIDIREGCELLWAAQPWFSATTAFFTFNGGYTGTALKVRRSILGVIGSFKRLFEYSDSTGFAQRDIDGDSIIGGFLAPVPGTNNVMAGVLDAILSSGSAATLLGTSGVATTAVMQNLRKMFTGDPMRDGLAKRTGANWPIAAGFNAGAYAPSGGTGQIVVGKTIVQAVQGSKAGVVLYTPAAELFAVAFLGGSTVIACGANGLIVRSTDGGGTWSVIASGVTARLCAIASSGTTVVIVGAGGTILRSTNSGAGFAALATPGTSANLQAVTYGNGRFAACGAGGQAGYSTDGSDTSWSFSMVLDPSVTWRGIAFGSSLFALAGDAPTAGGLIYTSPTMASGSFTGRTSNSQARLVGVASDGTVFAAVGVSNGPAAPELIASADGATWAGQPLDLPFDAAWILAPGVEGNRWAIGGRSSHQLVAHDPRGSAWRSEAIAPPSPAALVAVRTGADGALAAA